jgi:hypothetical protein
MADISSNDDPATYQEIYRCPRRWKRLKLQSSNYWKCQYWDIIPVRLRDRSNHSGIAAGSGKEHAEEIETQTSPAVMQVRSCWKTPVHETAIHELRTPMTSIGDTAIC